VSAAERAALTQLFAALSGPTWLVSTGWASAAPACAWFGVYCETADGNTSVTGLVLDGNGLSGELPRALQQLPNLRVLSVARNPLSGIDGEGLAGLTRLQALWLGRNRLTLLPASLFALTELQSLNLSLAFQSSATISSMALSPALRCLDLGGLVASTELVGAVGNLTALTTLAWRWAPGLAPEMLCLLPSTLTSLDVGGNVALGALPNCLPSSLSVLRADSCGLRLIQPQLPGALMALDLAQNSIGGVPPELCATAANLATLRLSRNQLSSFDNLEACAQLAELDVSFNRIANVSSSILPLLCRARRVLAASNRIRALPLSGGAVPAIPCTLAELSIASNTLETLPDWFCTLSALQTLDVSANRLSALPACMGSMAALHTVVASRNALSDVPSSFSQLVNLSVFIADSNNLTLLPAALGGAANLSVLSLASNAISFLPATTFCALGSLVSLNVSGNLISELPDCFDALPQLAVLVVSYNLMTTVPASLTRAPLLSALSLAQNNIVSLPDSFGSTLPAMTQLSMWGNSLESLPEAMGNLRGLQMLDFSVNRVGLVPESFGQLAALHTLSAWSNRISALPVSLGNMTRLVELSLSSNQLTELPPSIGSLRSLTRLILRANLLTSVPDVLDGLQSLRILDLSSNRISSLPRSIVKLPMLHALTVNRNELTTLPPDLCNLTLMWQCQFVANALTRIPDLTNCATLDNLDVSDNVISSIDDGVRFPPTLRTLVLAGNRLSTLPRSAFETASSLGALDVSRNQLEAVLDPADVRVWRSLQSANFSGNQLRDWEPLLSLIGMGQLTSLDVSYNMLQELDISAPQLINATALQSLDVSENPVSMFRFSPPCESQSSLRAVRLRGFRHVALNMYLTLTCLVSLTNWNIQLIDLSASFVAGSVEDMAGVYLASVAMLNLSGNAIEGSDPNFLEDVLGETQMLDLRGNMGVRFGAGFLTRFFVADQVLFESPPRGLVSCPSVFRSRNTKARGLVALSPEAFNFVDCACNASSVWIPSTSGAGGGGACSPCPAGTFCSPLVAANEVGEPLQLRLLVHQGFFPVLPSGVVAGAAFAADATPLLEQLALLQCQSAAACNPSAASSPFAANPSFVPLQPFACRSDRTPTSMLCSRCAPGYFSVGRRTCLRCAPHARVWLPLLGLAAAGAVLYVVWNAKWGMSTVSIAVFFLQISAALDDFSAGAAASSSSQPPSDNSAPLHAVSSLLAALMQFSPTAIECVAPGADFSTLFWAAMALPPLAALAVAAVARWQRWRWARGRDTVEVAARGGWNLDVQAADEGASAEADGLAALVEARAGPLPVPALAALPADFAAHSRNFQLRGTLWWARAFSGGRTVH
jgi:Leucine-rich repeat (LRR) protein